MSDPSSLVGRAVSLLQGGSVHTLDLAQRVLGLSGPAGAAAAAVYALLGTDPRFKVDGGGWWRLEGWAPGLELAGLTYAVVDLETTGGTPERGHRITEVAVVELRAGTIEREFQTLVNPGRTIPPRISQLTGITGEMVAGAPFFEDVAPELAEWLEGRVFVAHNASFDWRFLSYQMADAIGHVPEGPRLCTVQLARRLLPGLPRRNLDALATHFGLSNHARHRAQGDALATARILLRLLDEADARGIRDLTSLQALLQQRKARR